MEAEDAPERRKVFPTEARGRRRELGPGAPWRRRILLSVVCVGVFRALQLLRLLSILLSVTPERCWCWL